MFTILKAKTHHHNTHYDVALIHQNLQWFWFLSIDSMQKLFGDDTTCATESPIYMEKMCIHTYCLSLQNFKKMAPKRSLPMHSESLSAHLKVAARPPWVCRDIRAMSRALQAAMGLSRGDCAISAQRSRVLHGHRPATLWLLCIHILRTIVMAKNRAFAARSSRLPNDTLTAIAQCL